MRKILVILPAYNEEENIGNLLDLLKSHEKKELFDILVIDDGSKDRTADIVKEKEDGLQHMVEQGGRNLSGGQKQRLTIARALVKDPDVLILDDSASALDFATDAKLRGALQTIAEDRTIFIVSQRTSSILHADLILVLEDGEVAGMGTHQELLESCAIYKEIHDSQFHSEKGGVAHV